MAARFQDLRPLPDVCRNYNKKFGCSLEDCPYIHMCYYFMFKYCTAKYCTRSHTLDTLRNRTLLEGLGYFGQEDIELVFESLQRKLHGAGLSVCRSYNSDVCEDADLCRRIHVCHRYVRDSCPLEDCDLAHSVTDGEHNLRIIRAAGLADEPAAEIMSQLARSMTKLPFKPAICRQFYSRAAGCEGRCLRLHCCQALARGNCWYGDRCFKRHNLRDLHNQKVLLFYGCTESEAFAGRPWQEKGRVIGCRGDRVDAVSRSPERNSTQRSIEPSAWPGYHCESERCGSPEDERPDDDGGPSSLNDRGDNQSDRPTDVQRLIDYLDQYRRRKIRREQRRKEWQERLQRALERKEREDREVERIRRQAGENAEQESNANGIDSKDNLEQTAGTQSGRPEGGTREQQLELKVEGLLRDIERSARDLVRFHELARRQREYMECSICRGLLTLPVILSCSHTFCQACIKPVEACPVCFHPIYTRIRCVFLDPLISSITDMPAGER